VKSPCYKLLVFPRLAIIVPPNNRVKSPAFMLNFSAIPAELHAPAQRYWDQFEAAVQSQNLPHPRDLLPSSVAADEFFRQLTRAFVASEFIAKTVAQRPPYLI
jgi:glutamate-ammonia-ligase adenylyltransferase